MIGSTFQQIADAGALETVVRLVHRGLERRPVWVVSLNRLDNHLQLGAGEGESPMVAITRALDNLRWRQTPQPFTLRG